MQKSLFAVFLCALSLMIVRWPPFAAAADGSTVLFAESRSTTAVDQDSAGNSEGRVSANHSKKLDFSGNKGHYTLNGFQLSRIKNEFVDLTTADHAYAVRATFLETVMVLQGRAALVADRERVDTWATQLPVVKRILEHKDPMGSLKLIVYDLITPKGRRDLKLKEELVLLWSSDPFQAKLVGETVLGDPVGFFENVIDVQYRGERLHADLSVSNAYLQILYLQDGNLTIPIGALVIVARPGGGYEFYLAPRACLDQLTAW